MTATLEKILEVKADEITQAKKVIPLETLRSAMGSLPKCLNFYRTVTKPHPRGINVIAEIKRASPSAGVIRDDFDPVELANAFQRAGADALSVLTDETFFQGSLEFIWQIKQSVNLPILRKDFLIDPYQIYQSRVAGADAVLLIAEAVDPSRLMDMMILANSLSMTVLLEVHEMDTLLQVRSMVGFPQAHYCLLGINNRNLKTMEVDLAHSIRMIEFVEDQRGLISESGIKTRDDVSRLKQAGFNGVLVGEALLREPDVEKAFAELFEEVNPSPG